LLVAVTLTEYALVETPKAEEITTFAVAVELFSVKLLGMNFTDIPEATVVEVKFTCPLKALTLETMTVVLTDEPGVIERD